MADGSGSPKQKAEGHGFFQRILSLFLGTDDPEREKKRLLKVLSKELSRQKRKFYKPRSAEALPGLARYLFEIYKVVGPAQALLLGAENSKALKTIVIESRQTDDQNGLQHEFEEEMIRQRADSVSGKQLIAHVKDALVGYQSAFDSSVAREINDLYSLVQTFISFVRFDLYFVLRKFDSGIQEGNFAYVPRFETINAEYVADDIKDFLEVALPLDPDTDWDAALDVLQAYKGVDVVSRSAWKKALTSLHQILRSGLFVKIVQHIDQDPHFKPEVQVVNESILDSHLTVVKTQVEASLQKVGRERRNRKIEQLLLTVFGTAAISRTKHYTENANMLFTKKMMAGYIHTDPINYLKAFLLDHFKGEVRVLVSDLIIVRGQWSDNILSQQLSDAYYAVMTVAQQIVEFDDGLGEEGELGARLKKASGRVVEKDAASAKLLRQTLQEVNETAMNMVNESGANLITIGKILKVLIADLEKDRPELLQNWRDLESYSEQPLKDQLVMVYRRIYHFVQLLQVYIKK